MSKTVPHQVVTRDHLDIHSQSNRLADCLLGVRTRWVEEGYDAHPGVFVEGVRGEGTCRNYHNRPSGYCRQHTKPGTEIRLPVRKQIEHTASFYNG